MQHAPDAYLFPLIAVCALALFAQVKTGLKWVGYNLVFYLGILLVAIGAYFSNFELQLTLGLWLLLATYISLTIWFSRQLSQRLLYLDFNGANNALGRLHFVLVGKPFEFQRDLVEIQSLYVNGDTASAEEIIKRWNVPTTPPELLNRLRAYKLIGMTWQQDWSGTIAYVEESTAKGQAISQTGWICAARSYAELNRLADSADALTKAHITTGLYDLNSLIFTLLPVVSLSGDTSKTETLLHHLPYSKEPILQIIKNYWRARNQAAAGLATKAKETFEAALKLTDQQKDSIWIQRIRRQLSKLEDNILEPAQMPAASLAQVWDIYRSSRFASQIMRPKISSKTVISLIAMISLVFAVGKLFVLFGGDEEIEIVQRVLTLTLIDPQRVLNGEYYRLVTYMFLHKDEAHLFFNMMGLIWFGQMAQNIFGTWPLLLIFIVSGIAGGALHTVLDPTDLSIGASGGLLGLFSAVCVGLYRLRPYLPKEIVRQQLIWMIGLGVFGCAIDRIVPQIASYVHLGGLAAGVALGCLLPVRTPQLDAREI